MTSVSLLIRHTRVADTNRNTKNNENRTIEVLNRISLPRALRTITTTVV